MQKRSELQASPLMIFSQGSKKRGQVILISVIVVLVLAIGVLSYLYFSLDKDVDVDCGEGKYDSEINACVYPININSSKACLDGFVFNEKLLVCEMFVQYLADCEGVFNKTTNICTISPGENYICEEGSLEEIDGVLSCVVEIDIDDNANVTNNDSGESCSQLSGDICSSVEVCSGGFILANDSIRCCDGSCEVPSGEVDYENSPFAFYGIGVSQQEAEDIASLNVHWAAAEDFFPYKWREDLASLPYANLIQKNINFIPTSIPFFEKIPDQRLQNWEDYYYDLKEALENNSNIKYLRGVDEPEWSQGDESMLPWETAIYTRLTYKAAKDVNPEIKFMSSGMADFDIEYTDSMYCSNSNCYYYNYLDELEELEEIENNPSTYNWQINPYDLTQEEFNIIFAPDNYSKYMDGHHFSNFDSLLDQYNYREKPEYYIDIIKRLFISFGYEDLDYWNTQTGTHTGIPKDIDPKTGLIEPSGPIQTENNQANVLLRKYVFSIFLKYDKIFWCEVEEISAYLEGEHYFDRTGLIHNGLGSEDLGARIKKLGYYSYKLMVEKLEGSDWDNVEEVYAQDEVYVYKFMKNGEPIYVVWWDYFEEPSLTEKTISLNDLGITEAVIVTESIPHFENGLELQNSGEVYPDFFGVDISSSVITLGQNPVYLE